MEKLILILDKQEYKKKEKEIKEKFAVKKDCVVYYTEYEDALIRKVCKWKYVGEILLHLLYWWKSYRYATKIYKQNNGGKVISINPIVGIFLGMMNKKHKFSITLAGFLFEPKKNKLYYEMRKKVVRRFLKRIDSVVVYSTKEVQYYENIFAINKFKFVQYGIDYDSHQIYQGEIPQNYIFSGGRSNRDFHTLIEAFKQLHMEKDIKLCIATRPVVLQNENLSNVTVMKDIVLETFGDVIEKSKFVVLPLAETETSAGHQVLLEALERNKIVIVNKIDAVEDYVTDEQVVFFDSGNQKDLLAKMEYVLNNYQNLEKRYANNKIYYKNNFTFLCFIERLIKV